jgi:hypothetical protein
MKPIPATVALGDIIKRLECAEQDVAVAIIMSTRIIDDNVMARRHIMARRHDLHAAARHLKAARFTAEDCLDFCTGRGASREVPTV